MTGMKWCALESDLIGLRHGGSSGGTGIATYYARSRRVKDMQVDADAYFLTPRMNDGGIPGAVGALAGPALTVPV